MNLNDGTIRFPVSKSLVRTVPMTDRCVSAVARWLRQRGVGGGSLWSVSDPYSLVGAVVLRYSKGTLRPHALRRAFAVAWLERGGTETSLCRIAGWTSTQMIATYARASADVLAAREFRRLLG